MDDIPLGRNLMKIFNRMSSSYMTRLLNFK